MSRRWVDIQHIYVGARLRSPDMAKVADLAKSISEVGLLNPPAVRFIDKMMIDGKEQYNVAVLIVGHHRILALKSLGRDSVECDVYDVDPLRAELMEIDENLQRAELSPAEEAMHIARRKVVWEQVQAEKAQETGRQNLAGSLSDGRKKGPQHEKKFATELAEVTGDASSGLRQKIARARELGDDLHKIAGTSLDKGVEMDALIKMDEPERKKIIERAARGEQVSARPQPKKFEPRTEAERLAYDLHRWVGTTRTIEFSNRLRPLSATDFHAAVRKVVEA